MPKMYDASQVAPPPPMPVFPPQAQWPAQLPPIPGPQDPGMMPLDPQDPRIYGQMPMPPMPPEAYPAPTPMAGPNDVGGSIEDEIARAQHEKMTMGEGVLHDDPEKAAAYQRLMELLESRSRMMESRAPYLEQPSMGASLAGSRY